MHDYREGCVHAITVYGCFSWRFRGYGATFGEVDESTSPKCLSHLNENSHEPSKLFFHTSYYLAIVYGNRNAGVLGLGDSERTASRISSYYICQRKMSGMRGSSHPGAGDSGADGTYSDF